MTQDKITEKTHFGFKQVNTKEKPQLVQQVFDSVANKYDLMNDIMSFGLQRLWKKFTFATSNIHKGDKVLDIAGGSADMTIGLKPLVGQEGEVWHTDINLNMILQGRKRLINSGILTPSCLCDAENLPFHDNYFDVVCVAFGLRNMTNKRKALSEMQRVLKPQGMLLILEFSQVNSGLHKIYDWYLLKVLPKLGKLVVGDEDSYRYLAESIKMHPNQQELSNMLEGVGFGNIRYNNLTFGVVALHRAYKIKSMTH